MVLMAAADAAAEDRYSDMCHEEKSCAGEWQLDLSGLSFNNDHDFVDKDGPDIYKNNIIYTKS